MAPTLQYEFLVSLMLLIFVLELIARRYQFPPAVAFTLGGVALAMVPGVPELTIDPDLVLLIFLPPLLMNGAYFTVWRDFRANFTGIVSLALGAVVFTTLVVGLTAHALMPELPWAVCFALGAIVSPPDAVAAGALLERLKLPGRITGLLQGESLLNDATGLVLFRFAVASALTGVFSTTEAIGSFCLLTVGGVVVGYVIGHMALFVIRRVRDGELVTIASLLLPIVAYMAGEALHVSGVLATVVTGLLLGWHQHASISAGARIRASSFWHVLVFLLESIVFILIGLSLRGVLNRIGGLDNISRELTLAMLGVVAAVILSRFVWMFGSDLLLRCARRCGYARDKQPSLRVAAVMSWAGMRGVVTLVAALSLPAGLPGRDIVLACSFAVILVTVLVQGSTLAPLIRWMGLTGGDQARRHQQSHDEACLRMLEAQLDAVRALSAGPDGEEQHPRLLEQYRHRTAVAAQFVADRDKHLPMRKRHFGAVLAAIDAGRAEALRMHASGMIGDAVLRELEHELDLQQLAAETKLD